jgi:hypothetical protein
MLPSQIVRETLAVVCLTCAALGVLEAYISAGMSRIGEVPDLGGRSFWGGDPKSYHERATSYYIELRHHFRRSGSEIGNFANALLLMSVIAGLGIHFVGISWFAIALIIVGLVTLFFAVRLLTYHNSSSRQRLAALQATRTSIERDFPTDKALEDPKNLVKRIWIPSG